MGSVPAYSHLLDFSCPLTYPYARAAPPLPRMLTALSHVKAMVPAVTSACNVLLLDISMATSQMASSQCSLRGPSCLPCNSLPSLLML